MICNNLAQLEAQSNDLMNNSTDNQNIVILLFNNDLINCKNSLIIYLNYDVSRIAAEFINRAKL